MINWARVQELEQDIGPEAIAEVMEVFLEEVDDVFDRIGAAPGDLAASLHFLKGSAVNLGFDRMGRLCADGERAASEGAAERIDMAAIRAVYEASKQEVSARMAPRGP
jgi:HPt (histidine-containing phosphotransfer) domain-containing protein